MKVKRKRRISPDAATRAKLFDKELGLAVSQTQKVCDVLGDVLTDARKDVIEKVIAHRTQLLHVAVEGLYDPHNTAAIIRTADAFGVQNIHVITGGTRVRSSATVTKGAHKWVDVHLYPDAAAFVEAMKNQGIRVLTATMEGAVDVNGLTVEAPLAIVFGNESEGISPEMTKLADGAFQIPMFGFVESLNVSVAAAIAISTLRKSGIGDLSDGEKAILRARYYLRSVRAGYDIVLRS